MARTTARGILWRLAILNDAELQESVLFGPGQGPRNYGWTGLAPDARLLEAPLAFRYYTMDGEAVQQQEFSICDRPSTCIAHALALLLADYRGLRSRVRACPLIPLGTVLSAWNPRKILRDHRLHFFVDDRFKKGQIQLYCTPRHWKTDYMRRCRREQRATK